MTAPATWETRVTVPDAVIEWPANLEAEYPALAFMLGNLGPSGYSGPVGPIPYGAQELAAGILYGLAAADEPTNPDRYYQRARRYEGAYRTARPRITGGPNLASGLIEHCRPTEPALAAAAYQLAADVLATLHDAGFDTLPDALAPSACNCGAPTIAALPCGNCPA